MANLAELVWDAALRKLAEEDGESAMLLQESGTTAPASVQTVIDDIDALKTAHQRDGWNITIPEGTFGLKRTRVINVRESVYSVLEAALQFKDVVDSVLRFDATQYGAVAWSVVSFGMKASALFLAPYLLVVGLVLS